MSIEEKDDGQRNPDVEHSISLGKNIGPAPLSEADIDTEAASRKKLISTHDRKEDNAGFGFDREFAYYLLFGDPHNSAIVPGDTNKRLLEKHGVPKMSEYVEGANDHAGYAFRKFHKNTQIERVNFHSKRTDVVNFKNLLVLGGPIASGLTKSLCGYSDKPITKEGYMEAKNIPIYTNTRQFPAYFNIGTPESGYNVIKAIRPNPDGTPMKEEVSGTFSITHKGNILVPYIQDGKLRSDMLMIIRIPNPWHPLDGYITIIGGLHGYCLRSFFKRSDLEENLYKLSTLCKDGSSFQMLIPAEIDLNGNAKLLWDKDKPEFGDWKFSVDPLDSALLSEVPDDLKSLMQ